MEKYGKIQILKYVANFISQKNQNLFEWCQITNDHRSNISIQ